MISIFLAINSTTTKRMKNLIQSYVACYLHVLTNEGYLPYVKRGGQGDDKNTEIPLLVSRDHVT